MKTWSKKKQKELERAIKRFNKMIDKKIAKHKPLSNEKYYERDLTLEQFYDRYS